MPPEEQLERRFVSLRHVAFQQLSVCRSAARVRTGNGVEIANDFAKVSPGHGLHLSNSFSLLRKRAKEAGFFHPFSLLPQFAETVYASRA
jgi:hypothetical protein